jgi:kynurenine formamidase
MRDEMPVYPGTEKPQFINAAVIEKDGYFEKYIKMFSHTGTHMDSPAHIVAGQKTLDQFDISYFIGKGVVLDFSGLGKDRIELDDIRKFEATIKGKEYILIYSGWSKLWGKDEYFNEFPVLSEEATKWLLTQEGIKGIGLDMISIDPVSDPPFRNHILVLGAGKVIIENLTGLDELVGKDFTFYCLPLKIEVCDGISIRAVATI